MPRTKPYRDLLMESLADPETAAAYLSEALDDSPEMFRKALRNVAQARQMAKVARDAGVTRESLYKATSEIGNPTLDTLDSVLDVMDLKLAVVPMERVAVETAPTPPRSISVNEALPRSISVGPNSSSTTLGGYTIVGTVSAGSAGLDFGQINTSGHVAIIEAKNPTPSTKAQVGSIGPLLQFLEERDKAQSQYVYGI